MTTVGTLALGMMGRLRVKPVIRREGSRAATGRPGRRASRDRLPGPTRTTHARPPAPGRSASLPTRLASPTTSRSADAPTPIMTDGLALFSLRSGGSSESAWPANWTCASERTRSASSNGASTRAGRSRASAASTYTSSSRCTAMPRTTSMTSCAACCSSSAPCAMPTRAALPQWCRSSAMRARIVRPSSAIRRRRYVAALFEAVGVDRVVTLEVHNLAAFQNAFRCRTEHLDARRVFAES